MSDFDALQAVIARYASVRKADAEACEVLLNALYHAFRSASGPGLPLNNVSMDIVPDPYSRLRPVPVGNFHAAWFRLGLCEVLVRVRLHSGTFHGEFAQDGSFAIETLTEDTVLVVARHILKAVTALYTGGRGQENPLN